MALPKATTNAVHELSPHCCQCLTDHGVTIGEDAVLLHGVTLPHSAIGSVLMGAAVERAMCERVHFALNMRDITVVRNEDGAVLATFSDNASGRIKAAEYVLAMSEDHATCNCED